jgi:antitoxin component YwqK of YwqJK toxin-antitoxin module
MSIHLFLFSGSVYGDEEVEKKYWDNGKLMYVLPFKNGKRDKKLIIKLCNTRIKH